MARSPSALIGSTVRFGSLADICTAKRHVRFSPNSGHVRCTSRCLLCANSGHRDLICENGKTALRRSLKNPIRCFGQAAALAAFSSSFAIRAELKRRGQWRRGVKLRAAASEKARQISRLGALDLSSGIDASLTVRLRETASVTHQAACGREVPRLVDSGHRVADSSHCQRSASTIRRYTSRRWTFLRIVLGIGTDGCRHAEAVKGHSRLTSTPVSAGVGCWAASVTIRSR